MIIPEEIRRKWGCSDLDVALFLDHFDEPEGSRILVVGAKEESTCDMLAECGFEVTGIDLREPDSQPENWNYIRRDFCELDRHSFTSRLGAGTFFEPFDVFVAISAIEHFGLGTYSEGTRHRYYDVIAMRKAWELLHVGSKAYITVPIGGTFMEVTPHWRVYNMASIHDRLVQDFEFKLLCCAVSGECEINGVPRKVGDPITADEVISYSGHPPHLSALVVMEKVNVKRLAPNGR